MPISDAFGAEHKVNGLNFEQVLQLAINGTQPLADFVAEKGGCLTSEDWLRINKLLQPLRRRRGHPAGKLHVRDRERFVEAARLVRVWRSKEYPGRKRLPAGMQDPLIDRALAQVGLPQDDNTRRNVRNALKTKRHIRKRRLFI